MNHLKEVREAVIKAVPEKIDMCNICGKNWVPDCFMDHGGTRVIPSITLADVLRAIEKVREDISISTYGGFESWEKAGEANDVFRLKNHPKGRWNLALPLDEQPEEVIEFLYNILKV